MPNLTQLLSIELGTECNLGHVHAACPNRNHERYEHLDTTRTLNDGMIVRLAARLYAMGFGGMVAWHYYNEPLTQADRMFRLMAYIKEQSPQARFLLWTNGTLVPPDCSQFAAFDQIHVTDYRQFGHAPKFVERLSRVCGAVHVHPGRLDQRLAGLGPEDSRPCVRPFTEFVVDYYGNVHLCCYDWRGLASPGNVFTTPLDKIFQRWAKIREAVSRNAMLPIAPEACRRCAMRCGGITSFDVGAKQRAEAWRVGELIDKPVANGGKSAVVFVFYRGPNSKMPVQRLVDHFEWNHNYYAESGTKVLVVTDQPHQVPDYAECLIYPDPMPLRNGKPVFSHARTKNFGIRHALAAGFCPIIVTDLDMAYTPECWQQLLAVDNRQASVPLCWMAPDFNLRNSRCMVHPTTEEHVSNCRCSHQDYGATGTIGMTADNWRKVRFDDRCVGYGADDGIILASIRKSGVEIIGRPETPTMAPIYHIAHNASVPQVNFSGGRFVRRDMWDSEFNPVNFAENRRYFQS
jgi:hypothetical protein